MSPITIMRLLICVIAVEAIAALVFSGWDKWPVLQTVLGSLTAAAVPLGLTIAAGTPR